jgi:uncharacterized protein YeaO (DUF488 family)
MIAPACSGCAVVVTEGFRALGLTKWAGPTKKEQGRAGHRDRIESIVPIRTKRWNDPREEGEDGYRLLICRYRPRGVKKEEEPWDGWCIALSPSIELHAAVYGKDQPAITWSEYERRFREEMKRQTYWLRSFADRLKAGHTITLLCSSACTDESRCHRSLVRAMLEDLARAAAAADDGLEEKPKPSSRVIRRS